MKRFYLLLILISTVTSTSLGQNKIRLNKANKPATSMHRLIGTWRLIEFADMDSTGSAWTYRYGKHPIGYFTYTKTGIVNLNISSETPLKISEDSAKSYNINLEHWVNHFSLGYFGTYVVDLTKSIVTHHVKGGSLPWYIDTDQLRPFILKGDTLIIGDNKTWKRILVKAD